MVIKTFNNEDYTLIRNNHFIVNMSFPFTYQDDLINIILINKITPYVYL